MLNYPIELKTADEIQGLCYETEGGGLGQDYIAFNYAVLKANGFYSGGVTLVGTKEIEEGMYAYLIQEREGKKIYVHLDWIAKVNNHVVLSNLDQSKDMVKITRKEIFYPSTGEIKDIGDLPLCDCGEIGTTTIEGNHICNTCLTKLVEIQSYSFKPTPKFIGQQLKVDKEHPVWYGLEIEVSTNKNKLAKHMFKHKDAMYLKSDSSIRGSGYNVEMVTHPHSFKELMEGELIKNIGELPTNTETSNGLHIHISRTAFKDDRHYSLFYFLIHKMEKLAVKVGGRELTDYCKLRPSGKVHSKANRENDVGDRSLFLNERNRDTIEARFFLSTTDPKRIKADVQLLESLIKYTRYHTKKVTTAGWYKYVERKATKYTELLEVLGDIDVNSLTDCVVYKEPTLVTKSIMECTITDINNIVTINRRDRDPITAIRKIRSINFVDNYVVLTDSRGRGNEIFLDSITSVVVEQE